jgi:Na+/glutamate symporter
MGLSDLKHLKDLSWYTTVPLFVCASLLQTSALGSDDSQTIWQFLSVTAEHFAQVVVALFFAFALWVMASAHIDTTGLPLTMLLATFLLTVAAVGICVHFLKPPGVVLPANILWFVSFGSLSFNLFQIQSAVVSAQAERDQRQSK